MKIISGKPVAEHIRAEVTDKLYGVEAMLGRKPKLAILRAGNEAADLSYERSAIKTIEQCGMEAESVSFPREVSDSVFSRSFHMLNEDANVDGILLMRPFPPQINDGFITSCIDYRKDIDGVSPINAASLYMGMDTLTPCTAQAVIEILRYYKINIRGKHAVILGRSKVVGKPLSMLLLNEDATVTICHSQTEDLKKITKKADILISCVGKPRFINSEYIKKGCVVIDVGINIDENGKICGDVDFDDCAEKARAITPVPGGVGAVTSAVLAKNLIKAANKDLL
ncbi:MAG: bifunctional 5,10-methylenetetrahydrofolate dehydrogenase/5,10-methenyltetrahydrofolate cyclohydrolase [Eubacteriales bacterium]|nr:bifunctional 5,10-methylenetetrahydrofolate dehydrogenase/5,10-methenyltetrahydrofolate cyclohydrolase [Eubacteriales bacterium]